MEGREAAEIGVVEGLKMHALVVKGRRGVCEQRVGRIAGRGGRISGTRYLAMKQDWLRERNFGFNAFKCGGGVTVTKRISHELFQKWNRWSSVSSQ